MTTDFQGERFTFPSYKKLIPVGLLSFLIFGFGIFVAFAGDSLYGKVTAVKSPIQMTFMSDSISYQIRLIGIEVPTSVAEEASQFVSQMILDKNARIRFEGRTPEGEMLVRLFTDDSAEGIKEVSVELIKFGLAQRQKDFDYKYGELAAAEREAQTEKRGLWK